MTAVWVGVAVAVVVGVGWLWRLFATAPYLPTFDEHAATATALLQPDSPQLADLERIDFWVEVMDGIDALPDTHEREYHR